MAVPAASSTPTVTSAANALESTSTGRAASPSRTASAPRANPTVAVSSSKRVTVARTLPPGFAVTFAGSEAVSMATVKVSSPSTRASLGRVIGTFVVVAPPAGKVAVRVAALRKSSPRTAVPEVTVTRTATSRRGTSERRSTGSAGPLCS